MLSVETESKLADIFLILAEGEKSIDINRQILVELEDFDPFQIFCFLDNQQKNYVDSTDLFYFLQERGIFTNELELKLIILFYDRDYDGVLSYPEFSYFLQSEFSQKRAASNEPQQNMIPNISNNIDQALKQLLANEVELVKKILPLLDDLKKRYDFNIHDLYHAVKNWNFIEENSLRNFFGRNKISFLESDIRKIMKRLDFNGDGKVDFCEFHAFLGFPDCQFCCPNEECPSCGISCCNLCINDAPCFIHNCVHRKINIENNDKEKNINKNLNYQNENNENNLNLNNIQIQNEDQNQNNKINRIPVPKTLKQRSKTPSINFNHESEDPNRQNFNKKNTQNINNIKNNPKLNKNIKNNLNFNNYKNMDIQNQDDIENYNFNYNRGINCLEPSNSFLGPVSDNLCLRLSPKRKYSPINMHCNNFRSNLCRTTDYICNFIYNPEPCEKCIHNHCDFCHQEISSINNEDYCNNFNNNINNKNNFNNNNINNKYTSCQICHNFPCCCCLSCHSYPCICKICPICRSIQCKCCPKCNNFPCKCCPVCHSPECKCCPNCKNFPCKCCPVCHLEECCCCKTCHKYPCICCPKCHFEKCRCCSVCHNYPCTCCPKCHFENCRCCSVCNNYPCICCPVCHMPNCICCENCKSYPCRCCPDCHNVNCQCCIQCGCFPCKCCNFGCNCCQICDNNPCKECNKNPCICCPYCHSNSCNIPGCNCGKQCIAMSLNALNAMNCPFHNVNTMKHNEGCPYAPKCTHKPKCAHPKKDNNQNNQSSNSSINNNDFNNKGPNNNGPNSKGPNNNNQSFNNMGPHSHFFMGPHSHFHMGTHGPFNMGPHGQFNNSGPNNSNNNFPPNKNRSNNKSLTYSYNDSNENYPNNNEGFEDNQSNNPNYNNSPNNSSQDNSPYKQSDSNDNQPPNDNDNVPYNDNNLPNEDYNNRNPNAPNISYQNPNPNDNNIPNQTDSNSQNPNPNDNDQNNQQNPSNSCPIGPVSSAFPPGNPFFTGDDQPGQKSNWIFCPKCNVFHRCPHPGCDHNPNKRTTTHKCIHDDNQKNQNENNMATPNFNNNNFISFNPNQGRGPIQPGMGRSSGRMGQSQGGMGSRPGGMDQSQGRMSSSQSRRSQQPRKRDVISSSPYQEELRQFLDFLGFLMEIESKIEDLKIELARRDDFNFEDLFRIFEVDGKGYIEPEDLKQGLKLLGLDPSDFDIKLLLKRFDLNQQNLLTYSDFFDMVVSFEKKLRNSVQIRPPNSCCPCKSPDVFECDTLIAIKNLFKFIIDCEREINQMRVDFDSLRSKYSDVVQFLDVSRRGVINRSDLKLYLTQFNKFTNSKECDLLFIRLDKTRSGEVGNDEIENELMFIR